VPDGPALGAAPAGSARGRRKWAWTGGVALLVLVVDLATKLAVQRAFRLHDSVPIFGDIFRLTYIFNPGAAFGLHLGPHSRYIFLALSLLALCVLALMYRNTPASRTGRLVAIGAIAGGALGNIVDRIRSPAGVVDFLDLGIGSYRWPVFNLADVAVSLGALALFLSFWSEDRRARAEGGSDGE
jgi:signal peptidase II